MMALVKHPPHPPCEGFQRATLTPMMCLSFSQNDTILEMYRKARAELRRPWIVDDFEAVKLKLNEMQPHGGGYKKV